jgi:hypothetical protein
MGDFQTEAATDASGMHRMSKGQGELMAGYHARDHRASKLRVAYRSVDCPSCGAKAGDPCHRFKDMDTVFHIHITRSNKYKYEQAIK